MIHENKTIGRRQCTFDTKITMRCPKIPQDAYPIDIITQTDHEYITGKLPQVYTRRHERAEATTLQQKIDEQSDTSFFNDVKLKLDESDIAQLLQRQAFIDLATDGSYDQASGISSYGWVVLAIDHTIIASGNGPTEAHPMMAEPFRKEI
jgi:hypothetical protein